MGSEWGAGYDSLREKYIWCTRGANCPICNSMRGRVYTFDRWQSNGVFPGFHLNCNCYLQQVAGETPESDIDIFGSDQYLLGEGGYFLGIFKTNDSMSWFKPFSWQITYDTEKAMLETGLPIGAAIRTLSDKEKPFGQIFNKAAIAAFNNFFQWRVHRTLRLNSGGETIKVFSAKLHPQPHTLGPIFPYQSHKYSSYRRGAFP